MSMHVPPCWHGPVAHGLSTTSQLSPEKPSGHVQRYLSGRVFSHVPPFTHGSCVPQKLRSAGENGQRSVAGHVTG